MKNLTTNYCSIVVAIFVSLGAASMSNTALAVIATNTPNTTRAQATWPVPPDSENFMWQTLQKKFLDQKGNNCKARIAIAVSDHATCYSGTDGVLLCEGSIYTNSYNFLKPVTFKNSSHPVVLKGVDQIMLSATFNVANGNAICAHKIDGTVWCMGSGDSGNSWGQFGVGDNIGHSDFVQWGGRGRSHIKHFGTGTWDQMCAITTGNEIWCSGYSFGLSPIDVGASFSSSFYVSTFGSVEIDPVSVYRASAGRTDCTVSGDGLDCNGKIFKSLPSTSSVVDGGQRSNSQICRNFSGPRLDVCLLSSEGTVECMPKLSTSSCPQVNYGQYFGTGQTLALATNGYTSRICAVKVDGSIWCADRGIGSEVRVQPPGSVPTSCLNNR